MSSSRLVQIFLCAIISALVATGVYTYWAIRAHQQTQRGIDRYDVTYSANQNVVGYERFRSALARFAEHPSPAGLDEVRLRFEILFSNATMMGEGEFRKFAAEDPARAKLVADFEAAVRHVDALVTGESAKIDAGRALSALDPFSGELVGLAADAYDYSVKSDREDRSVLSSLHERFAALVVGLFLCGFCLVSLLIWNNRMLVRAHESLTRTTRDLGRAAADLSSANEAVAVANAELRSQNRLLVEKEDALRARTVLFDAALNNMSQGLCMFDETLRPLVCNTQFERLFHLGCPVDAEMSDSLCDFAPELAGELEENVRRNRAAEFETECYDGRIIAVAQRPMADGGWVATFADVTEQRRTQARIAHMARHDGLTNLPNRYAFRERIQDELNACRENGSMLAVMCLDLDNFKEVNDSLGHPTGDALLCAVAERLAGCVRDTDMVARFGGDEFAILQPGIERLDDAERLASRLLDEMRRPFLLDGELVYTTGSIGVAIAPKHGGDPVVLQKNADLALYAAKADGRRTVRFFENEMDERLASRHVLERDLRQAIAGGQFHLEYQPIINLATMQTVGLEALLRWTHPVLGAIPPGRFVPVAEEAGLIADIGRWVLEQACADAVRWPAHIKLSVNLSPAQFHNGDIVQDIRAALSRAGLRPDRLVVEITESLLLTESISTLNTLNRLKALGIEVAMDDFGTGYSSLSYLRKYPFDRIKIDRGFVNAPGGNEQNAAIVRTIVQLAAAFGMTTVAEGVETDADLRMLVAAGCPEAQGHFFSRPMKSSEIFDVLRVDELVAGKVA